MLHLDVMADLSKPMMPSFTGPVSFFREVRSELAKVVWPSRDSVIKLTVVVIAVSLVLGLYIGGLDALFTKITDLLVKR
jgi:preprotein translocase subunit SecE